MHDILTIVARFPEASRFDVRKTGVVLFHKEMKLNASSPRILPASAAVKANSEAKFEQGWEMKCRIGFVNCDNGSAKHLGRGGRKPADDVCIDNSVVIAGHSRKPDTRGCNRGALSAENKSFCKAFTY